MNGLAACYLAQDRKNLCQVSPTQCSPEMLDYTAYHLQPAAYHLQPALLLDSVWLMEKSKLVTAFSRHLLKYKC